MEKISCNLCGKDNTDLVFKIGKYRIVRCKNCGLKYVNPRDSFKKIKNIYNQSYFELEKYKDKRRIGYFNYPKDSKIHSDYFRKKLKELKRVKEKGKLLDIGCATGIFLDQAKKQGFNVWGIDISPYAVVRARKTIGRKRIFRGQLKNFKFKKERFDIITSFQTIEHLVDPIGEFLKIYNLLTPGGCFLATTPNEGSTFEKMLRVKWFAYKPKEHLYYFNTKTLQQLLEKAGFRNVYVRSDDLRLYPLYYIIERVEYLYPNSIYIMRKLKSILKKLNLITFKIPIFLGDLHVEAFKPDINE